MHIEKKITVIAHKKEYDVQGCFPKLSRIFIYYNNR